MACSIARLPRPDFIRQRVCEFIQISSFSRLKSKLILEHKKPENQFIHKLRGGFIRARNDSSEVLFSLFENFSIKLFSVFRMGPFNPGLQ